MRLPWKRGHDNRPERGSGLDSLFRKVRLLERRQERMEETVRQARRRADSAHVAASRAKALAEARPGTPVDEQPPAGANGADPRIKAGMSLATALRVHNEKVTGG